MTGLHALLKESETIFKNNLPFGNQQDATDSPIIKTRERQQRLCKWVAWAAVPKDAVGKKFIRISFRLQTVRRYNNILSRKMLTGFNFQNNQHNFLCLNDIV